MNDSEYEAQRKRIQDLAEIWLPCLGLKWWKIDLVYEREGIGTSEKNQAGNWQCNANASVKWEYLRATLRFNMLTMEDQSDTDLERIFVHECCHVLVAELREWGPETLTQDQVEHSLKHEERVVSGLTSAFLWTARSAAGRPMVD